MQKTSPGAIKDAESNHTQASTTNITTLAPLAPQDPAIGENFSSLLAIRKQKYGTRWKQQRLLAYRQTFDVIQILILFMSLGAIFLILAAICYYHAAAYPPEIEVDYTHCQPSNRRETGSVRSGTGNKQCFPHPFKNESASTLLNNSKHIQCTCQVKVMITTAQLEAVDYKNLILHYELTKFHQNVRRYRKEVDWDQLAGRAITAEGKPKESHSCTTHYSRIGATNKPIFPCGKIANSYFSDTFRMFDPAGREVKLTSTGIAWPSDKRRFKNPTIEQLRKKHVTDLFDLPRDWHNSLKSEFFDDKHDGIESEHFMVWMRTAAMDKFRNKYAYIGHMEKEGEYTVEIQYRFEVESFKGTKKIVIAVDYKNYPVTFFFFNAYLAAGLICFLTGPIIYAISLAIKTFNTSSPTTKTSRLNSPTDDTPVTGEVEQDTRPEYPHSGDLGSSTSRSETDYPPTTKPSSFEQYPPTIKPSSFEQEHDSSAIFLKV